MTPSWLLVLKINLEWCSLKSNSFWIASYLKIRSLGSTPSQNLTAIMILKNYLLTNGCLQHVPKFVTGCWSASIRQQRGHLFYEDLSVCSIFLEEIAFLRHQLARCLTLFKFLFVSFRSTECVKFALKDLVLRVRSHLDWIECVLRFAQLGLGSAQINFRFFKIILELYKLLSL